MKPVRAYASLYRVRNKVNLLLFICLLAQIFFLLTGSQRIPLPSRFVEVLVNSFLPNDILVKLERPEILGFSELECENLNDKVIVFGADEDHSGFSSG